MEDVRAGVRTTSIGTLSKAKEQQQRREREGREELVCETHGDGLSERGLTTRVRSDSRLEVPADRI